MFVSGNSQYDLRDRGSDPACPSGGRRPQARDPMGTCTRTVSLTGCVIPRDHAANLDSLRRRHLRSGERALHGGAKGPLTNTSTIAAV